MSEDEAQALSLAISTVISESHISFRKALSSFYIIVSALALSYAKRTTFPIKRSVTLKLISRLTFFLDTYAINESGTEFLRIALQAFEEGANGNSISFTSYSHLMLAAASINGEKLLYHDSKYQNPKCIHIETQALCNAKCSFCDYSVLSRKGSRMSDKLIDKILNDLSKIPLHHKFQIQPYKLSEPFLDERLSILIEKFLQFHPASSVSIISNGSYIPEKQIESLYSIMSSKKAWFNENIGSKKDSRLSLSFSLNEVQDSSYKRLMKLNLSNTIKNIEAIHSSSKYYRNQFPIRLTRVSTSSEGDYEFTVFCNTHFPNFSVDLLKINDWTSNNSFSCAHPLLVNKPQKALGMASCKRWQDLSITATGDLALCCMDSGDNNLQLGNAKYDNVLSLYRRKCKEYVPHSQSRSDSPSPCANCSYHQGNELAVSFEKLFKKNVLIYQNS